MKNFCIAGMIFVGFFIAVTPSFSEDSGLGLDELFGVLGDDSQTMEREDASTASSIRGLNPVDEKYGASHRDLSRYVNAVRKMELRQITKKELRKFLTDARLGKKVFQKNIR